MKVFNFSELRLIISYSAKNNSNLPYYQLIGENTNIFSIRVNLIKTLKTYITKYCLNDPNKFNILYLSILYLDIILSKNRISLSYDKNLKFLCLCCFLLSLKFMGNYDMSKKIIKNFCYNYREQYKIFEIECLVLLEHNLIYTTVYDYINMILMKEQKNLLEVCSSLLYQLCEDNLYVIYSPFYISIAIIQLAKKSINDISYNHYYKYFQDQRVKYLYRMFNNIINPEISTQQLPVNNIKKGKNHNYSENNGNTNSKNYMRKKFVNNNDNNIHYNNIKSSNSSNINIITNNNIQNNIVIINEFLGKKSSNKKSHNNTNSSNYFSNNNTKGRKTCITNKNKTPIKIINRYTNTNVDLNNLNNLENQKNNEISEFNYKDEEYKKNIYNTKENNNNNNISKNSTLSKSYFNNSEVVVCDQYCQNTHKVARNRQSAEIKQYKKIKYYPLSSNKIPSYCSDRNYEKSSYTTKRSIVNDKDNDNDNENNNNEHRNNSNISNNIFLNNVQSSKSRKKKIIYLNKSSLNFQLVSGVSKDKLVKLSRNLSKLLMQPSNKLSSNQKCDK